MNALVTEEPIDGRFVKVSFAGSVLLVLDKERGFFNPTRLRQRADKKWHGSHEPACQKQLKLVLEKYSKRLSYNEIPSKKQSKLIAGWYLHPTLLLNLAQWMSLEAFIEGAIMVGETFSREEGRKSKLSSLLDCGELAAYEAVNRCEWLLRYADLEFIVDKRGWFDTREFCITHNTKLDTFHKFCPGISDFIEYLRNQNLFDERYYHPLLFLRLAAWVNLDYFVKCVRVVFCSGEEILDTLFRKACKELQSVSRPTPNDRSMPDSQLTDEDTDDSTMTREQLELEVEQLRRKLDSERQAAALVREELDRLQKEKQAAEERERLMEAELKELRKKQDPKDPNEKTKNEPKPSRLANPLIREDIDKQLKNLVLYVSTDGMVVAYRQKFTSIVSAIYKDRESISAFAGWFVTKNPRVAFKNCRDSVKVNAEQAGHTVEVNDNKIKVKDIGGRRYDLPGALCETLRKDSTVMEANVRELASLFKMLSCEDYKFDKTAFKPEELEFLKRVYKKMEDERNNYWEKADKYGPKKIEGMLDE